MSETTWAVVMDPVGMNGENDENRSGVAVYLSVNGRRHEVSRVAFVRRYAEAKSHRVVPFKTQLRKELEKAYDAAATMNAINADVAELRRQLDAAEEQAQKRIAELLEEAERKRDQTLERLTAGVSFA